ncbi:glucans biosynthesis glucosyltransferase MdoH [Acuticoccus sp. MNP-M23]|uniref:glucans biosynthesis glucosyltransferase MdoH n=1 Tax=Acuticoccus sp. MNP-M23 TaxID=3072793 RepID=UPI002814AC82|nr:glucans biosynthesis glucosyltransferase MdoH [Acuticoccus sp. MNP-M23]WMS44982.1 glucans biosynthesis glucosyltransferase MdoH [Acuticoccus sp. MNP-M23]
MDRLDFAPPPAPRDMPEQALFGTPPAARFRRSVSVRTMAARTTMATITVATTIFASNEMRVAASPGGVTFLEWVLVAIFTVAFAWIAFSAANALVGLLFPFRPAKARTPGDTGGVRTAIVMPIYNEDPRTVFAALAAMARDLPPSTAEAFEIFILSDTTDPEVWVAEEGGLETLRALCGPVPVWYRRRSDNSHRKAGNVGDFVRRWGDRYGHMVVLDADSVMTGACLAGLREAMLADPQSGIIQTSPVLIGAVTPFARAQQFANTVAGPTVGDGVAAWQGEDGNYWGHNAIIRMEAFAAAAGLPSLPGAPPFGGTILSHDFVEAALIRRAGYSVTLRSDLTGSYEGAPSDLFGVIKRDRRWAQGNLQHSRIIGASGLALANRVHFAIGILAYLMSPIWLALILVGVVLSIQATLVRPEYFPTAFALFPTWPVFDSARLLQLFMVSLAVLLLPKAVALVRALFIREIRRGCGGGAHLAESMLVELLVSTLIAPIMMIAQTSIVLSVVFGRAVGWTPQAREGQSVPWLAAIKFHAYHMLAGLSLALIALLHSPTLAAWMSPTLIALILAVPISKGAGSARLGAWFKRFTILTTPQERTPANAVIEAEALRDRFMVQPPNAVLALAGDAALFAAHRRALSEPARGRGAVDAPTALATVKLDEANSLEELAEWLDPAERMGILSSGPLLDRLRGLRPPDGPAPA